MFLFTLASQDVTNFAHRMRALADRQSGNPQRASELRTVAAILRELRRRILQAFEQNAIPLGTGPNNILLMHHDDINSSSSAEVKNNPSS